jgi:NAD(P)-dependent dehydrogenase (short-subunit alcohol dehydrogenase family)
MPSEKIALVTGANRGIGFEIVRQLAKRGFHVVLAARNRNAGERAASKLQGGVAFQALDVSDDASIEQAVKEFGGNYDHLNVLVNSAGIYPDEGANIVTITRQQLVATFQTNTFGPLRVVQAFLPYLNKAELARVINVSSGYGELDGLSRPRPIAVSPFTTPNTTLPESLLQLRDMFSISRFDNTNNLYRRHFRSTKRAIMRDFLYARPN